MSRRIERFEDFIAWQKARALTAEIYVVTGPERLGRDYGLRDQMRRASVSIMSNIAEGFERGTAPEFHRFLAIAKATCAELRSQLYVGLDVGYFDEATFRALLMQAEEVGRLVGGLRVAVAQRRER
jgi:four helix bundle protein